MSDFWRVRLPIWVALVFFVWLLFNGPKDLFEARGTPSAQAGYFLGYLLGMALWIIALEAVYRLISWLRKPWRKTH